MKKQKLEAKTFDRDKLLKELYALCKPVNEWLQLNHTPFSKILIEPGSAIFFDDEVEARFPLFDGPDEPKRDKKTFKYLMKASGGTV